MTGKDLILYILQNNLEDKPIFIDRGFMNLISEYDAAVKFDVGLSTVKTWFELGMIEGVMVGEELYILPTSMPRCSYRSNSGKFVKRLRKEKKHEE